ncbi:hypothetical protein OGAPHI_006105 [Ogataea philodendri]|uniref:Uncharacterized protein n=1 Tax=Ogataea philodendri TaxID=1378263 RepID=A0A9P8T1Q1_9ASCO|nr:uncharacterized protein OGAPHI_006105 [Ogataea philodendri]KAH3661926.1 hypothetical protein OGAPHI_006105 [Ogataea philodendri]
MTWGIKLATDESMISLYEEYSETMVIGHSAIILNEWVALNSVLLVFSSSSIDPGEPAFSGGEESDWSPNCSSTTCGMLL